jgi:hypothetical protein
MSDTNHKRPYLTLVGAPIAARRPAQRIARGTTHDHLYANVNADAGEAWLLGIEPNDDDDLAFADTEVTGAPAGIVECNETLNPS